MVGVGLPSAAHFIMVFLSFSTAFKVGDSVILGYPLGTGMIEKLTNCQYGNKLTRKFVWMLNIT